MATGWATLPRRDPGHQLGALQPLEPIEQGKNESRQLRREQERHAQNTDSHHQRDWKRNLVAVALPHVEHPNAIEMVP